jgi:predicted Zn-ribbon and HTH transcriptional regulator
MLVWPDGPVQYSIAGGDKLAKLKREYSVFWRADDGTHFMGNTLAVSEAQACNNVHYRQIAGEHTIMRSNMVARLSVDCRKKTVQEVPASSCQCGYSDPLAKQASVCPNCDCPL